MIEGILTMIILSVLFYFKLCTEPMTRYLIYYELNWPYLAQKFDQFYLQNDQIQPLTLTWQRNSKNMIKLLKPQSYEIMLY